MAAFATIAPIAACQLTANSRRSGTDIANVRFSRPAAKSRQSATGQFRTLPAAPARSV